MWPRGILSSFATSEPYPHRNKTWKRSAFTKGIKDTSPCFLCQTHLSVDVVLILLLWCKTCTWNTTITICFIWIYSIYKVNVLVLARSDSHLQLWKWFLMDVKQISGNYVQEFNLSTSDWEVLSEGWDWEKAAVPLTSSGEGLRCPALRSVDNAEEAHYPARDIHLAAMPLQRSFKLWFAEGKRPHAKLSPKTWGIWYHSLLPLLIFKTVPRTLKFPFRAWQLTIG